MTATEIGGQMMEFCQIAHYLRRNPIFEGVGYPTSDL
jgi:hypothetical protein